MDKTVSTRVADRDAERIEDYADSHGMTRSEAVRHLLRDALGDADQPPGAHVSYGTLTAALGTLIAAPQYADASGLIGPAGIALVLLGAVYDGAHRLDLL